MKQAFSRHEYLDSLRGVAILAVVAVHTAIASGQMNSRAWKYAFTGQRGVQLFYIISAFTLCLSMDSRRAEHRPLLNYFLRRFFRIAPLFYVAIAVNLVENHFFPNLDPQPNLGVLDVLSGMLFLNGARPHYINAITMGGWSVAVETTFYLVLPFLFRRMETVRQAVIWFAISDVVLGSVCHRLALHAKTEELHQYFSFLWFPVEFPIFLLGILAYRIWQSYVRHKDFEPAGISLALLLASALIYVGNLPFSDDNIYSSSLLFLPLLLSLAIKPRFILVNPFTRFIGKISYSLYLLHFYVLTIVYPLLHRTAATAALEGRLIGWALEFAVTLAAAIPVCLLTWRFIEEPGIRLGRQVIAWSEGRRQIAPLVKVGSVDAQV